jgi:hypothetical protein
MGKSYRWKYLRLKSALIILIIGILPVLSFAIELSTYDVVLFGKTCTEAQSQEISCEYRVGKDLHFTIDGIGGESTGITFMKSNFEGNFYPTFGLRHGCVIVKRGKKNWKPDVDYGPGSPFDYAFISPKNGKVYRDWVDCKEVR